MFKFLRKYNKWILAVGGTLLMIVFLIPQAISTLSQRAAQGSAIWATVGPNDDDVSADIRRQCEQELRVLEAIQRQGAGPSSTDRPEHWFLLIREAEKVGLVGGLASDQLSPDQMQSISSVIGKSALADQALGKRMAIDQMLGMYLGASKLSDNRIRRQAERLFHSVDARFVVLQASDEHVVAAPTEEEIRIQYEKFRDVAPRAATDTSVLAGAAEAADEDGQGFGYRLPDRFKLEWLRIESSSVEGMIEASDALNNVALFKHWERNQTARGFPPLDEDDAEAPEVPDIVRTDLLRDLTTAKLADVERYVTDRLFATWRTLRIDNGYRVLPADWTSRQCDLEALARELQSEFPGLELPAYRAVRDRWLRVEDVTELEGIENVASNRYNNTLTPLGTLIGAAHEFGGDNVILTQVGIADPPLRDRDDDSIVFFRIIEADPSRSPHDVDEVRDAVVRDLRRKSDYERLVASMESLEASARKDGLLGTAMANEVDVQPVTQVHLDSPSLLTFQLQNNFQLQRMSSLPVLGAHKSTIERIIDHAMALPRDKDVRELPAQDRIFALAVDDRMTVVVVELLRQAALSNDGYSQLATLGLQNVMLSQELADIDPPIQDVFGYDALAARQNFKVKQRETAETLPDGSSPVANADQ